jgi:hypothetical protein
VAKNDYSREMLAFFRDLFVVEGAYGPKPVIPPFLQSWINLAFPLPDGNPAARNILDGRTKKEGKSALAGAVALYMASRKPYQEVVIVASDKDQAKDRVLRAVKFAVEQGPISNHAKVYRDVVELNNKSIIQAMPMDWRGAAGGNYSAIIFDELHAWVYEANRRLFDEMVIPPTEPNGVRWIASYAGWLGESLLLKEWWDKALAGERLPGELPFYRNKAANLLAFIDIGPDSWRMPWMESDYISEVKESERPNTFRRLFLNEWVANESQFLPEGAWEACYSKDIQPLAPGDRRKVVIGVDGSTSRDLTALIAVEYNQETNTNDVCLVRVWKPERGLFRFGKPTIDLAETLGEEVKRLHEANQLEAIICDPYQLHTLIIEWQKMGIRVIELAQSAGRVESDQALYDAVIGRAIRHYNEPTLNLHVKNAIALDTIRGYRITKERTSMPIDACVALSMANYGASQQFRVGGKVETLSINPFYNDLEDFNPQRDLLKINDRYEYMPGHNTRPHPLGITWRNCKQRVKGCKSCVDEMTKKGIYEQDRLLDHARMVNAANERAAEPDPTIFMKEKVRNDIKETFWSRVKNRQ